MLTKGNTVYVDVDDNKNTHVDDIQDINEIDFLRNLVLEIQSEKKELHKLLDQQHLRVKI